MLGNGIGIFASKPKTSGGKDGSLASFRKSKIVNLKKGI
jgi:hypothetical protein